MKERRYLALLRGINVGGNNIIKMAELKACFEKAGFSNVLTYIQSGNVIFSSPEKNPDLLCERIEDGLSHEFGYKACVVLVTGRSLEAIVEGAPRGFGEHPSAYRYDVIFLKKPLTATRAMKDVPTKEGVDEVFAGKGVLYFSRLIRKATQSRLSKIIQLPVYKSMTIRNWNTTTKLLRIMGGVG